MTMAMISNSQGKGGIVDFVFVGSETQQQTVSGHKVAEVKRGLKLSRKVGKKRG